MSEKSIIAKIEEAILRFTKPDYMDSKEKMADFLAKKSDNQKIPNGIFKSTDINGTRVFTFGNPDAKNTVLYVHGGAFVNEINYQHLLYCFLMSRKLDTYVLAPVYPLAPSHTAIETFEIMMGLYEKLILRDNLILMGDSAGGGFVHSFCQYLKTTDFEQPGQIITFSPWVDISMSNGPFNSRDDPILGEAGLKEIGKSWAGSLNGRDYRVSPLFGGNTQLPKTLIFAGENEIFYSDIQCYVEKLKKRWGQRKTHYRQRIISYLSLVSDSRGKRCI